MLDLKHLLSLFSKEFFSSAGWNLIGQIVVRASNFLITIIVARNIGVTDYAFYSYFIGI